MMATQLLTEKYATSLDGVLGCFDRIVITGSLAELCYAKGMTHYLYAHDIRIFDYARFAEPLRDELRANAEALAQTQGLAIEYIRKKDFRKEERIQALLEQRGSQPGLVHIFSAMEPCASYRPWHDKASGHTYLQPDSGKCLHYYFYFIDADLGLCYLRVPTWCPFRLQFYCNGHARLAHQLSQHQIAYTALDNAFGHISDYGQANQFASQWDCQWLRGKLDDWASQYCPVVNTLQLSYYWSLMQVEYALDLVFKSGPALAAFYPHLLETLIHAVKPQDIATFLGHKLHGNYQGEVGNNLHTRIQGTRIRHHMGPAAIKMYDKFGRILRIEVTVNDVAFFQQRREVVHRNGESEIKWAPMQKTICSLPALRDLLDAATHRYLAFLSDIESPALGVQALNQLTQTQVQDQHRYKGFTLLSQEDASLFRLLLHGEFTISGFTNKALRQGLPGQTSAQVSRLLKRLRVHRLIKKVGLRYKYYLTDFGRQVATLVVKLRELHVIPHLAQPPSAS
jgi:hypothetical protein